MGRLITHVGFCNVFVHGNGERYVHGRIHRSITAAEKAASESSDTLLVVGQIEWKEPENTAIGRRSKA